MGRDPRQAIGCFVFDGDLVTPGYAQQGIFDGNQCTLRTCRSKFMVLTANSQSGQRSCFPSLFSASHCLNWQMTRSFFRISPELASPPSAILQLPSLMSALCCVRAAFFSALPPDRADQPLERSNRWAFFDIMRGMISGRTWHTARNGAQATFRRLDENRFKERVLLRGQDSETRR